MKQERTIEINNLFKNIQTAEDKKEFISWIKEYINI